MLCVSVSVITVSVPVAEVFGVEEGRVEILPHKSIEDTDKDFTGQFIRETPVSQIPSPQSTPKRQCTEYWRCGSVGCVADGVISHRGFVSPHLLFASSFLREA